jgi:uncharacterized protein YjbI with pentapeptide repeats
MSAQNDHQSASQSRTGPQSNWPVTFKALKSPPGWIANTACLLLGLAGIYLLFLALVAIGRLTLDLLGDDHQAASDAVKSLLPIAAAAVGLPLIVWRLVILSQQTRISEMKTQIDRETHYTSIFSRSVEQMGLTREFKESREVNGTIESSARTVPNIEVRLGGIHSLARLAEESARDVGKIENMLRSYVRENSWCDRDGVTTKAIPYAPGSTFSWAYHYRLGDMTADARNEMETWANQNQSAAEEQIRWGKLARETRVDVNEAIDAIATLANASGRKFESRFYECLFVGRFFQFDDLEANAFDRCTFVRCRFNIKGSSAVRYTSSTLIDCRISCVGSNISLSHCVGIDLAISRAESTKLELRWSQMYRLTVDRSKSLTLNLSGTYVHKGWIGPSEELQFNCENSDLVGCAFRKVTFRPSTLDDCSLPGVAFYESNLSAIEHISEHLLAPTEGDPGTRHPAALPRPDSWPAFDPEYKDEDFPF